MNKPLLCEVHGVEDQRPIGWPRCPFCKPPEQPPRCVAVEVGEGNTTAQCVKPSGHAGNHSNGTFDFMDPIDRDYPEVNETPPGWKVAAEQPPEVPCPHHILANDNVGSADGWKCDACGATPRKPEVPAPDEVWVETSKLGAPIAVWADKDLAAANYSEHASAIVRYVRARGGGR